MGEVYETISIFLFQDLESLLTNWITPYIRLSSTKIEPFKLVSASFTQEDTNSFLYGVTILIFIILLSSRWLKCGHIPWLDIHTPHLLYGFILLDISFTKVYGAQVR